MTDREEAINELQFQLNSKEVKEQHYPVQLSASDAEKILSILKEQEAEILQLEAELDILRNIYKQENPYRQAVKFK